MHLNIVLLNSKKYFFNRLKQIRLFFYYFTWKTQNIVCTGHPPKFYHLFINRENSKCQSYGYATSQ